MASYAGLKKKITDLVEATAAAFPTRLQGLRASLGNTGTAPDFNTVVVATVNGTDVMNLAGSAWGPALDRKEPDQGPDPILLDRTVMAMLMKGVAEYTTAVARYPVRVELSGAPLATGTTAFFPPLPQPGRILGWSIIADNSGSVSIDVRRRLSNIPGDIHSVVGSGEPPGMSSDIIARSSDLTGWDVECKAGDVLGFEVDSVSGGINTVILVLDISLDTL